MICVVHKSKFHIREPK